MSILTPNEQQIAIKTIHRGHTMAAKSFSVITNQLVTAQTPVLKTVNLSVPVPIKSRVVKLVTTEMKGDILGKSFLLLDEEDCNAINQSCLSPTHSGQDREIMSQAIIKEIDNIISASVITEISNWLRVSIYGDVPHLYCGTLDTIKPKINDHFSEFGNDNFYFFTNTYFLSETNIRLQPQFLWKLNASFLRYIKDYAQTNFPKP